MPAKDIRRETPDVTPSQFIRPGVTNTAVADAIRGVGGSVIELDVALAKERLGKDLDQARSEFIVGEMGDNADPAEDAVLKEQLDKELAPFKAQLSKMSNAEKQGLLRSDRFRMQADAILQSHIARRPGLGPEFREIHAQYTGGAIIETLMRREQAMFDAAMQESKGKEEQMEKNRIRQLEALESSGFVAEAGSLAYASPEEVNATFMRLYPQISRQERTVKDAQVMKAGAEGMEAGMAMDRPVSLRTWQTQYNLAMEGALKTLRMSGPQLAAADEESFAGMVTEWRGALAQVKANLEATRTSLGLKPDDVSAQMQILADLEKNGAELLNGKIAFDERKRRVETYKLRLEAQQQQDSPLIATLATLEERGAHETIKFMFDQNAQLARQVGTEMQKFIVDGQGDPATVAPLAAGFSQALLRDMFPNGGATKSVDVDMPAAVKLLTDYGTAFAVTPSDQFKVKPYTEWIEELSAFANPLSKLLDPEHKQSLSQAVMLSSHKALRVGYLSLLKSYPSMRGNLVWSGEAGDEPFKLNDESDPVLAKVVDQANQAMAHGNTLRLLTALGMPSEEEAHKAILKASGMLAGTEAKASQERQEAQARAAATGVQGGGAGGALTPAVGAVEQGYRFKGGDPSKKENWEKVE